MGSFGGLKEGVGSRLVFCFPVMLKYTEVISPDNYFTTFPSPAGDPEGEQVVIFEIYSIQCGMSFLAGRNWLMAELVNHHSAGCMKSAALNGAHDLGQHLCVRKEIVEHI